MPTTSPISGWPIPQDSDPVKDGAKATRDLVDGIEAAWTAYTPVNTNLTLGNGTVVARYKRIGKTVHFRVAYTGGTTSSAAGGLSIGLPFAAHASGEQDVTVKVFNGTSLLAGVGSIAASATKATLFVYAGAAGGAMPNYATFGNGQSIVVQGTYEAA